MTLTKALIAAALAWIFIHWMMYRRYKSTMAEVRRRAAAEEQAKAGKPEETSE